MRRLKYMYHMRLNFEYPVKEHHFTLRCFPADDDRQKILKEHIEIYPIHYSSTQTDSFGNRCVYGTAGKLHSYFAVDVSGEAETCIGINKLSDRELNRIALFKYETGLTKAGENIRSFHNNFSKDLSDKTPFEKAVYMMDRLFQEFSYVKGVTGVSTTAEEAFAFKKGVCQDYAHILLSLCRLERIPCRYVAGMMTGEGMTHAWTEVFDSGIWHLLDPTHNRECDDNYIKISSGRDAHDCSINQGVFIGGGKQEQEIKVIVSQADNSLIPEDDGVCQ